MNTTTTTTRYALRTITAMDLGAWLWVHDLQRFTMPSATEDLSQAKTWASARGAQDAAKRHGLTNVQPVAVIAQGRVAVKVA
jgi:hypothetical protein